MPYILNMQETLQKVVTFGELMLRLMPEGFGRFIQADKFDAQFGGAEANVAVSLSNFGLNSTYITKLPENPLGQAALNSLRRYGVDTSMIARGGSRLGLYFLEKGASQRGSLCVYDRKGSSFAESNSDDYNWDLIFKDAKWFHVTGVTPALSDGASEITLEACRKAKALGITVSCDLNYRSKLWSIEKARSTMQKLSEYVDVCIANEDDAENVFGIKTKKSDTESGIIDKDAFAETAAALTKKFNFKKVAITLRKSINASENIWSALLYKNGKSYFSRDWDIQIVERVGSGDSFAAGLIYSLLTGKTPQDAVEFASAAACLKHTIEGDFNMVTASEVESLVKSHGTGRVIR